VKIPDTEVALDLVRKRKSSIKILSISIKLEEDLEIRFMTIAVLLLHTIKDINIIGIITITKTIISANSGLKILNIMVDSLILSKGLSIEITEITEITAITVKSSKKKCYLLLMDLILNWQFRSRISTANIINKFNHQLSTLLRLKTYPLVWMQTNLKRLSKVTEIS
jgi:hypothetical protein